MINFADRYVPGHTIPGRVVKNEDLVRVREDAHVLYALCFMRRGRYPGAFAMAHTQMCDQDPLAFFVTKNAQIIINPRIIRHTEHANLREEGCMSYPDGPVIRVKRFYKCEVEYQDITADDVLSEPKVCQVKGIEAEIFQHEIDHLNGVCIYGNDIPVQNHTRGDQSEHGGDAE